MTVVAIDGPAAAGKSTVARRVAQSLGFRYLDSGAMYRAVALAALEAGVDLGDSASLEELVGSLEIRMRDDSITVDSKDVTTEIRDERVSRAVSAVAADEGVRRAMTQRQQFLAQEGDIVIEGRDIGAAITPGAEVKIFLTASTRERARRRCRQLGLAEDCRTIAEIEESLVARDSADASRTASPFVKAPDAVVVDSTSRGVDEVVEEVLSLVREVLE
jgi:cytidylate kinase